MITVRTRSAILLVIFNTLLVVLTVVCISMHVMDRTSPAWKGGPGLPKMHVQYLSHRAQRRNRLLMKEDIVCSYNNTMTLFVLSDGVNFERRNSIRKMYRDKRTVRNFCLKYFFVVYGDIRVNERSHQDYVLISSYVQGYVEPQKIHFTYKSKPKADLKLKSALAALQEPTSSESSSEETTEDVSEETEEETIEEDDTKRKERAVTPKDTVQMLSGGRDVRARGKRHVEENSNATTSQPKETSTSATIHDLLHAIQTPRDVTTPNPSSRTRVRARSGSQRSRPTTTDRREISPSSGSATTPATAKSVKAMTAEPIHPSTASTSAEFSSYYTPRSGSALPQKRSGDFLEGIAYRVKKIFGTELTTPTPADVDDEDLVRQPDAGRVEAPRVALFASRCNGYNCSRIEVVEPCNCTEKIKERLLPDTLSRMNSIIRISKIHDNRQLEEASSNSRWKVFVQEQQPVELTSLVAQLNYEAKVLAKLDPCCTSLDECTGCNHMFRQKLLVSTRLAHTVSTKDTYEIEDDVRKILWNDPNDVILEFHVEPRGKKATRYWKVFNM